MKSFRIIGLLALIGSVTACGGGSKGGGEEVVAEFNPLVESFTRGAVSRTSHVQITFAAELPNLTEAENAKSIPIKITPKVNGKWIQADRQLTFMPEAGELARGTTYRVDVDLKKLFPDSPDAKDFAFSFRTYTPAASAELGTIIYEPDGNYTVRGTLYTADLEDSTQIRRMVSWKNGSGEATWEHSPDGKSHTFAMTGIAPAAAGQEKVMALSVNDPKAGYKEETLLWVPIPQKDVFGVISADYLAEDTKHIEVRFTKPLDTKQNLGGLIRLQELNSTQTVDGNRVLIYPEQSDKSTVEVLIDAAVKSADGDALGQDVTLEVQLGSELPQVRFVGEGMIVPVGKARGAGGGQGAILFQAINLRAVQADIFRISERAVGQFLQENNLTGGYELVRTARPVATKTIFLDQPEKGTRSLQKWSTYSLNLDQLLEAEPGALYTVRLSFDRSMSGLDCIDQAVKITPQGAAEEDAKRLKRFRERFDAGGYYWDDSQDWSDFRWRDREDPCTPSYYYDKSVQRNLLVTDLGLIAKGSDRAEMLFLVNSLTTAKPVDGVRIDLMNYQGQRVASGTTDARGEVTIGFREAGRPYYAVASKAEERAYLKVNPGSELSTSTFDVSGQQVQDGIRGFVWTERGVWRPGDTIHLNVTTAGIKIPDDHPVTVELRSPLGQLYQKQTTTQHVGGIYSFTLHTDPQAPTGVWNSTVTVGGAVFTKRLRVEAIKPNRLKIDLKFPSPVVQAGKPWGATLHGEWLTGAKAGNLKYTIETSLTEAGSAWAGRAYEKYVFNNAYKQLSAEQAPQYNGTTDADGNTVVDQTISGGDKAGGMLYLNLTTRLFEPGGEASIDGQTILYSPFGSYVGIRPPDGADRQLDTDKKYSFNLATITPEAKAAGGRKVEVRAYKVQWYWWWDAEERSGIAQYISNRSLRPVHQATVTTDEQGRGTFPFQMGRSDWGTYYVTAKDQLSGHESAVLVYLDWPNYGGRRYGESRGGAMQLNVSLDKQDYKVGDRATVKFPASAGSRAIISVENGTGVLRTMPVEITAQGDMGEHTFEVTADMQPNVYLNVTLLQPFGAVQNDLPVRLYGVVPLAVSSADSKLEPQIGAADEVLPESQMQVTVSEKQGRQMSYTLVLVDEGLLDLTRFRTPDPWAAFNARVALGVRTWDVYNNVLGAYGGKIEQLFAVGGDGEAEEAGGKSSVNRFPPVVKYLGAFTLGKGQKKTHTVRLPAYMGRVRVMAVAVSQEADGGNGAWGSADKSVTVRAPLMLLGTAPRAVAAGDELIVPATLIATQDGVGKVKVSIQTNELFTVLEGNNQEVTLNRQEDKMVYFRLRVRENADARRDAGHIKLTAQASGGKGANYAMDIPVRNLMTPVMQGNSYTIATGKKWEGTIPTGGLAGTRKAILEVSTIQPINAAQRTYFLSTYPYGCIEQITSGAFPFLYLPDLTELKAHELSNAQAKVRMVLNRYKQYALPDGYMGYWPGSSSPASWGAVYALHFMTTAKLKGYEMPAGVYDRLRSAVLTSATRWNAKQRPDINLQQAYQLYVLALGGDPQWGAMNRLRQGGNLSRETSWMLAAAYGVGGRSDVGRTIAAEAQKENTGNAAYYQRAYMYSSTTRERSVELLATSVLGMKGESAQLASIVSKTLSTDEWLSTQSTAWAMLSLGEYVLRSGLAQGLVFDWTLGTEKGSVNTTEGGAKKGVMWNQEWDEPRSNKVSIENKTAGTLYVRAVGSWISAGDSIPAATNGLEVSVRYLDANGNRIDVRELARGVDFVSEVTVHNSRRDAQHDLMLSEPIASGWEILPMVALSGDDAGEMGSLPDGVTYRDVRDDRVDNYIPILGAGQSVVVRTRLNASYGGVYTLPSIRCAAMYDDSVSGNTASYKVQVKN